MSLKITSSNCLSAIATGALGVKAWYTANANAQVTKSAVANGNLVAGASTASVTNGFTITPSAITTSNTLAFTDTSGDTFVSVYNGTGYDVLGASTTAVKVAAYTLKATISYSGDLNTEASIQALWQATVTNVVLRLQCTAVDNTGTNTYCYLGLRVSEFIGLAWDCYDRINKTIEVKQQILYLTKGKPVLTDRLKTRENYRKCKLSTEIYEILEKRRRNCSEIGYIFPKSIVIEQNIVL